jgi:2-polyprenyl-6-methoxyphenol hydroxylase-like FAD-dependent oxidoreductase
MCVDEDGRRHAFSVPPPLIRKDLIARMRAEAAKIMPPAFLDALAKIERPFFTPIYDFAAPRLVFGRVALVGDAAATARPHMGFGVAKAGGDAWALAEALRGCQDIDAALARYDAERQPMAERIVLHGRKLGTFLGVDLATEEDRRMSRLLSQPCGQMEWIAVPDFLGA